ncbi:hypothetical protein PC116_g22173 [Phytophthora cactorum]|uniref:Uncharacterized protein n=1 Tax=Phytophthora cactorum TaxID=29920 RepID=A0A8T1AP97_9STRA|nr:hypothetical protein PC113_g19813 [Phytophthora cactorum]KAG2886999.1 hypothetical protein PC115_g20499 [Phytophthora cactorum]KAG2897782.1 hypothetical protein PC117_g22725 [Phytophthora cactorum]KAG2898741.1 hypothetical protein PC114_g14160 [Phytophthora cactorum]KAG2965711.1 hypothetical protein PC118_g19588 [Phytophthora cactorum]
MSVPVKSAVYSQQYADSIVSSAFLTAWLTPTFTVAAVTALPSSRDTSRYHSDELVEILKGCTIAHERPLWTSCRTALRLVPRSEGQPVRRADHKSMWLKTAWRRGPSRPAELVRRAGHLHGVQALERLSSHAPIALDCAGGTRRCRRSCVD